MQLSLECAETPIIHSFRWWIPSPGGRDTASITCRGRACPTPDGVRPTQPRGRQAVPLQPAKYRLVPRRGPLFLPPADSEKTNERTGNVDENKGRPATADNQLQDFEQGGAFVFFSLNTKTRSQSPLPGERVACGGAFIRRRRPGEGLVPVHTDILPLIPLTTARNLACLSLPSQSRRLGGAYVPTLLVGMYASSVCSGRGKNPSPVTLRLMTPPEPDTLPDLWGPMVRSESDPTSDSPRERALHQSGRAIPHPRLAQSQALRSVRLPLRPRLAQTCFPRSAALAFGPPVSAGSAAA